MIDKPMTRAENVERFVNTVSDYRGLAVLTVRPYVK
jgi:hypothetical protein